MTKINITFLLFDTLYILVNIALIDEFKLGMDNIWSENGLK